MSQFLDAVSFRAPLPPRYGLIRGLFVDGAQLIKNSGSHPEIFGVEEFIEVRDAHLRTGLLTSFREVEVAHDTFTYGNVGHRLSVYRKTGTDSGISFDVLGCISTQVVRTPTGWKMSGMSWDDQRPGLASPLRE